jgi:hypothetical protein
VEEAAMEEGMLELDLDEEDVVENSKFMGIVVFYSIKSYNPHNILPNMISAWGIQKLTTVEKICDYIFKLEFDREEEKVRVLEGGPWHHKGDVFIMVHYDGFVRPSEICISFIGLWVHFYDLQPAMMKPSIAK